MTEFPPKRISVRALAGEFAENKDVARSIRTTGVIPALKGQRTLVLDFSGVNFATQSFIHACLSEAIRKFRDDALKRLEFRSCNDTVKSVVLTVVDYSLGTVNEKKPGSREKSVAAVDVPQADDLGKIRTIVWFASSNRLRFTIKHMAMLTKTDERHVSYRIHAARILGFLMVSHKGPKLTAAGHRLLQTRAGGEAERVTFWDAIKTSAPLKVIAPDLLDSTAPTEKVLAERIAARTGIAKATARRRAVTLLAWRKRVVSAQLELPIL